jgi:hypothetical protein
MTYPLSWWPSTNKGVLAIIFHLGIMLKSASGRAPERVERERANWLKMHLQLCLGREAEVVTVKGEAIYGRLAAFSVDVRPPFIILETENSKIFVNLFRVERFRVAKGQEAENTHYQPKETSIRPPA